MNSPLGSAQWDWRFRFAASRFALPREGSWVLQEVTSSVLWLNGDLSHYSSPCLWMKQEIPIIVFVGLGKTQGWVRP